jgi:predicted AlkP superfamily phosphohydrolase/phosphomutase
VVVLGFDGLDARTVRELLEKDPANLPTFRRLAETGTFAPLEVVVPAESSVSWASLNSGQNPAKTGVPGFIKREITESGSVLPGFGFIRKDEAALETFEHAPIPTWGAKTTAALAGALAFLVVLLLGALVLRKHLLIAGLVALAFGGAAAFAAYRVRSLLPASYPRTFNVVQTRSFWDYAADAGVPCVVLDAAQAFDAESPSNAKVLHGLGLPDARGGIGDWFVYTTDPAEFEREGRGTTTAGTVYRVDELDGVIQAKLYGPPNFVVAAEKARVDEQLKKLGYNKDLSKRSQELAGKTRTSVELVLRREGDQARVEIDGQEQLLAVGQWSDFYELTFVLNPLVKVHALTRVRLVQLEPHVELFVNVLDIDPRNPPFWQPISSPFDFSAEIAEECGLFETYGWPTLTMPFKDEEIEPELLLEDIEFTEKWREKLTHARLAKDDWRCLVSVFSTPDRMQHMTYQYYDSEHPRHDPAQAARETTFFGKRIPLSASIPAIYAEVDRITGEVLAKLAPEDTLLVCSDHGFQSFRRQVHLNNWLLEEGYLALKSGIDLKKNSNYLKFVDWKKTRVYSVGLGLFYLNLQGREPEGIVPRAEAKALLEEVEAKLLAATDPANGQRFCKEAYVVEEIHVGPHLGIEADLIPGFAATYRIGWSTSSGGLSLVKGEDGSWEPAPSCTDNDSNWSGDHVSMALSEVAGVFLSNRKVKLPAEGVRSMQIAPTVLQLLGVPVPAEMDLEPLELE